MNDKNALIFHSIAVPNSDYGSESRQSFKKMSFHAALLALVMALPRPFLALRI